MIYRIALSAVMVFTAGWLGMEIADRDPPSVVLKQQPEGPVPQGGTLRIHYELHRFRSCEQTHDRIMFDSTGVRYTLDGVHYAAAPGPLGDSEFTLAIPIPKDFTPGESVYWNIPTYACNITHRLWPIVAPYAALKFNVLPASVDDTHPGQSR